MDVTLSGEEKTDRQHEKVKLPDVNTVGEGIASGAIEASETSEGSERDGDSGINSGENGQRVQDGASEHVSDDDERDGGGDEGDITEQGEKEGKETEKTEYGSDEEDRHDDNDQQEGDDTEEGSDGSIDGAAEVSATEGFSASKLADDVAVTEVPTAVVAAEESEESGESEHEGHTMDQREDDNVVCNGGSIPTTTAQTVVSSSDSATSVAGPETLPLSAAGSAETGVANVADNRVNNVVDVEESDENKTPVGAPLDDSSCTNDTSESSTLKTTREIDGKKEQLLAAPPLEPAESGRAIAAVNVTDDERETPADIEEPTQETVLVGAPGTPRLNDLSSTNDTLEIPALKTTGDGAEGEERQLAASPSELAEPSSAVARENVAENVGGTPCETGSATSACSTTDSEGQAPAESEGELAHVESLSTRQPDGVLAADNTIGRSLEEETSNRGEGEVRQLADPLLLQTEPSSAVAALNIADDEGETTVDIQETTPVGPSNTHQLDDVCSADDTSERTASEETSKGSEDKGGNFAASSLEQSELCKVIAGDNTVDNVGQMLADIGDSEGKPAPTESLSAREVDKFMTTDDTPQKSGEEQTSDRDEGEERQLAGPLFAQAEPGSAIAAGNVVDYTNETPAGVEEFEKETALVKSLSTRQLDGVSSTDHAARGSSEEETGERDEDEERQLAGQPLAPAELCSAVAEVDVAGDEGETPVDVEKSEETAPVDPINPCQLDNVFSATHTLESPALGTTGEGGENEERQLAEPPLESAEPGRAIAAVNVADDECERLADVEESEEEPAPVGAPDPPRLDGVLSTDGTPGSPALTINSGSGRSEELQLAASSLELARPSSAIAVKNGADSVRQTPTEGKESEEGPAPVESLNTCQLDGVLSTYHTRERLSLEGTGETDEGEERQLAAPPLDPAEPGSAFAAFNIADDGSEKPADDAESEEGTLPVGQLDICQLDDAADNTPKSAALITGEGSEEEARQLAAPPLEPAEPGSPIAAGDVADNPGRTPTDVEKPEEELTPAELHKTCQLDGVLHAHDIPERSSEEGRGKGDGGEERQPIDPLLVAAGSGSAVSTINAVFNANEPPTGVEESRAEIAPVESRNTCQLDGVLSADNAPESLASEHEGERAPGKSLNVPPLGGTTRSSALNETEESFGTEIRGPSTPPLELDEPGSAIAAVDATDGVGETPAKVGEYEEETATVKAPDTPQLGDPLSIDNGSKSPALGSKKQGGKSAGREPRVSLLQSLEGSAIARVTDGMDETLPEGEESKVARATPSELLNTSQLDDVLSANSTHENLSLKGTRENAKDGQGDSAAPPPEPAKSDNATATGDDTAVVGETPVEVEELEKGTTPVEVNLPLLDDSSPCDGKSERLPMEDMEQGDDDRRSRTDDVVSPEDDAVDETLAEVQEFTDTTKGHVESSQAPQLLGRGMCYVEHNIW